MPARAAAFLFTALAAAVCVFQLGLAAGMPWGRYAMGGAVEGVFPPAMRLTALVQAALFVGMSAVVLDKAGVIETPAHRFARGLARAVAALMGLSLLLNLATPSADERMLWAPVAAVLFVSSVFVARAR